ncbi:hypothetical protein BpHYR1_028996 [Brachionus plicatilis]|uniref:Uncharacterized protein n=1 Tax=Brachionus plicatilis TaxID=10195 RepID=A0A3M7P743_BRAPC|nr:hypothetical protein BpHYR1_028996 [Brachionus plicatilis]
MIICTTQLLEGRTYPRLFELYHSTINLLYTKSIFHLNPIDDLIFVQFEFEIHNTKFFKYLNFKYKEGEITIF